MKINKLSLILTILIIGNCSTIENALIREQIKRDMLTKYYVFEVYQNGTKLDEVCIKYHESFTEDGFYYKKTDKICKGMCIEDYDEKELEDGEKEKEESN